MPRRRARFLPSGAGRHGARRGGQPPRADSHSSTAITAMLMPVSGLYCSCGTQRANRYVCTRAHMHTGARVKSLVQSSQSGWQEGCGVPTHSTLTINDQRRSGSAPIGMICAGGGCARGSVAPTVRCTTKAFSLVDTFQQNTSALPVALDQEHDRPGSYALMAGAASLTHPRMRFSRFRSPGHGSVAVWLGGGYVEFLAHVLSKL